MLITESLCSQNICSVYLWSIGFDWWAALRPTVQGKMNERLSVRQRHLMDNIVHS